MISDVYGQRGGAYRVTSLLCQTFADLGIRVTCFATWVDDDSLTGREPFNIVRPLIRRGYQWDIPNRILAWQASRFIHRTEAAVVIVVGLTGLCGYLLSSNIADRLLVWELTNADAGNKFVSPKAAERLHQCRAVLSPAKVIDDNIRETYGYTGEIKRLPFWIEDEQLGYTPPPDKFGADFIFLARREDDKGLRELIRATGILREQRPLHVQIAGPGNQEPYQRLAEELDCGESIEFVSLPQRAEAMEALGRSRFLVLPSYHEGYPLSLLEAARLSVPFIATEVGSVREIFGDSPGCHIIPARDAAALANAMEEALTENDTYDAKRRAIHTSFTKLSSANSVQQSLLSLSQQVSLEQQAAT